jgi:hypothetical protein
MRNFKTTAPFARLKGRAALQRSMWPSDRRFRIINESVADGGAYENPQTKGAGDFNKIGNSTTCRQIRAPERGFSGRRAS